MKKPILLISIVIILILIGSCKKEKTSFTLCTGNFSNTYLPLEIGNTWYTQTDSATLFEIDSVIDQSGGYYYLYQRLFTKSGPFGTPTMDTIRVSSNGDIYKKVSTGEYLVLPASPTTGQSWRIGSSPYYTKFIVLDNNATISTPSCNYSSCLKLATVAGGDSAITYYHKSIGMVRQDLFISMGGGYLDFKMFLNKIKLN